jgi:hypothetical protein
VHGGCLAELLIHEREQRGARLPIQLTGAARSEIRPRPRQDKLGGQLDKTPQPAEVVAQLG